MADIKKVNGYDLKDEFARQEIENLREDFENNENVDLSQYATIEYVDGIVDNFDSNVVAGDVIDAIEDNYFVSLNQFLPAGGVSDYAPYINQAIRYCMQNYCSLLIPDGEYVCASTISIPATGSYSGVTIKGQSRKTCIVGTGSGPIFHAEENAHRLIVENLFIEGNGASGDQIGIMWEGSQGVIRDVGIYGCGTGIWFDTECWCTNAYALNINAVHTGIRFGAGAGGCYVDFTMVNGDTAYDNPQPNGSIGIKADPGSHMNIIGEGGQVSCFHYCFDLTNCVDLIALTVGRIYVEHNYAVYTPTSKTVFDSRAPHLPADYLEKTSGGQSRVTEITCNGPNKSTVYNPCRDSAIPVHDLLAYFTFKRGNDCFKDLSGNEAVLNNSSSLNIVADDKNLFGRSHRFLSAGNGSSVELNIPNLGNKFTMVMSFRQASDIADSQMRYFELSNKDASNYNFLLMFLSAGGNTLLGIDQLNNVYYNNMSVLSSSPYTADAADPYSGSNAFVAFAFDLDEGTVTPFSPYYGVFEPIVNEQLKGYANGNINFNMFKSWSSNVQPFVMNYLAVFDGVLGYDQLLNIYRETTPLIR